MLDQRLKEKKDKIIILKNKIKNIQSPKPSNANGSSPMGRLIFCSLRKTVAIENKKINLKKKLKRLFFHTIDIHIRILCIKVK
jgi:hypothetical protein